MVKERTPMNPVYIFFRYLNFWTKTAAAQFDSFFDWLKRHCSILVHVWILCIKRTAYIISYLLFLLLGTVLVSFGQTQASARNVYILIHKYNTRWCHIPLKLNTTVIHFCVKNAQTRTIAIQWFITYIPLEDNLTLQSL